MVEMSMAILSVRLIVGVGTLDSRASGGRLN